MQRILIIALVLLVFVGFLTLYTVRFTETAVVTTMGKAGDGSIKQKPGLHFKIPVIQSVTKYDTRARIVETNLETQLTRDDQQVVVTAYLMWRVDDAKTIEFFRRYSGAGDRPEDHYKAAETQLRDRLRGALAKVSQFNLTDLLSSREGGSRIPDLEKAVLDALSVSGAESLESWGVSPLSVGITAMMFPQAVTTEVVKAMNENRDRIAKAATETGAQQAAAIRAKAENDAKRIMAFADALAKQIRSQGEEEAAAYYKQIQADPELAVFLENMRFLRETVGRTVTLVLPTTLPGFGVFRPDAMNQLKPGEIPSSGLERLSQPLSQPRPAAERPADNSLLLAEPGTAAPSAGGRP